MKIVIPIEMTDSKLIKSNIPENDYPEYSSTATYSTGDRVIVTTPNIHSVYEVVATTNVTGVYPPDDDKEFPDWLKVGATNRWKSFDSVIGTQTEGSEPFSVEEYSIVEGPTLDLDFTTQEYYELAETLNGVAVTIRPDNITDTLAVFNVSALSATVKCVTIEGVIYERVIPLGGELSESNWYSYFLQPIERRDRFMLSDLPPVAEKDILISFTEAGTTNVKVGEIVTGRATEIGRSLYGTNLGIIDFSRKERDAFGNFSILERGYADTMEVDMSLDNRDLTFVRTFLSKIRAKPAIYIAGECFDSTTVYGYFTDFQIVISGPERSDATIVVEGLI